MISLKSENAMIQKSCNLELWQMVNGRNRCLKKSDLSIPTHAALILVRVGLYLKKKKTFFSSEDCLKSWSLVPAMKNPTHMLNIFTKFSSALQQEQNIFDQIWLVWVCCLATHSTDCLGPWPLSLKSESQYVHFFLGKGSHVYRDKKKWPEKLRRYAPTKVKQEKNDRQTDRQTNRHRQTQRDRHRQTGRHRQSQTDTDDHRQSQIPTDSHRQSHTVTDSHTQSQRVNHYQSAFNSKTI